MRRVSGVFQLFPSDRVGYYPEEREEVEDQLGADVFRARVFLEKKIWGSVEDIQNCVELSARFLLENEIEPRLRLPEAGVAAWAREQIGALDFEAAYVQELFEDTIAVWNALQQIVAEWRAETDPGAREVMAFSTGWDCHESYETASEQHELAERLRRSTALNAAKRVEERERHRGRYLDYHARIKKYEGDPDRPNLEVIRGEVADERLLAEKETKCTENAVRKSLEWIDEHDPEWASKNTI